MEIEVVLAEQAEQGHLIVLVALLLLMRAGVEQVEVKQEELEGQEEAELDLVV